MKLLVACLRTGAFTTAGFLLLALSAMTAQGRELKNFDVRAALPDDRALVPGITSARLLQPGAEVQADRRFGVPSFVWAARPPAPAGAHSPEAAARRYLEELAPLYRLTAKDATGAVVTGLQDTGRGSIIVQFGEQVDGVPVYGARMSLALDRDLRLVAVSGSLAGAASKGARARAAGFGLQARQAVAVTMDDLGLPGAGSGALRSLGREAGPYERFEQVGEFGDSDRLIHPARVRRVYLRLPDSLEPAYAVEVMPGSTQDTGTEAYEYWISAGDGRVLARRDLVDRDAFKYRVWAGGSGSHRPLDGPTADYSPHPTGNNDGSSPGFVKPVLVSLQNGPISTNDPWLPRNAVTTSGNNVDAYADLKAPDGFSTGDVRAATTGAKTFDRTYDTSAAPGSSSKQRMAAVTQLFYTVNWLHDWFYDAGFDEASGNAQKDNYGRGGAGNDPLLAEAQDFSGVNNANMFTPTDGSSPRMQMYVWTFPNPDRDGTIDNQIVAHEWGHYIFHRLVPAFNKQSAAMSEGWSDFIALLMTARAGDQFDGVYAMAGYSLAAVVSDPFYFGIRRYPYSTNLAKNPLSYHHVDDSVALPGLGTAPRNSNGFPNSEVHNAGEIWASTMWECYVGLLQDGSRLTFDQAEGRMRDYVVAAFKLTPGDPTFVEQRDAVLAVMLANDPSDFQACARAFAKRGMGSGAVAPARYSENNSGVVESFALTPSPIFQRAILAEAATGCPADGIVDNNDLGTLNVILQNSGLAIADSTSATISSPTAGVTFPSGSQIEFQSFGPIGGSASGSVLVTLGGVSGMQELDFQIDYEDASQPATVRTQHVYFLANADVIEGGSSTDGFESPTHQAWTSSSSLGGGAWNLIRTGPMAHRWKGDDPGSLSDHALVSAPIQVAATGSFGLSFQHRHSFERSLGPDNVQTNWDGGVIEIQQASGAAWEDLGVYGAPGYGGTITDLSGNPLSNRQGYVGKNAGYPNFNTVNVNLGTALQGKSVRLRFRIGCDEAVGDEGWEIDDVIVTGAASPPFPAVVAQQGTCPIPVLGQHPGELVAELLLLLGLALLRFRPRTVGSNYHREPSVE